MHGDAAAIEALYPLAFPDEDLVPLVRDLLQDPVIALSLVATIDSDIAGHAVFTHCGVDGSDSKGALLGPLAVSPGFQRQGIGSAIVRDGLQRLRKSGVHLVCVLGDPAYYERFGFMPEIRVATPYPVPAEWEGAWRSLNLGEPVTPCEGKLSVPPQWQQPALWAP